MKSPICLIMVILGLSMLGVLTTSTRMLAHLRTHNKALSKNKNTLHLSTKLKTKAKSQVKLQGTALNTITMSSEDLKALATKDKEGARNLIKYLNSQLLEAEPAKDPKDAKPTGGDKDAKPAGGDKDAKPAGEDKEAPKEEAPQPDPEGEPITGKTDPGLVNVIPTKFNLTDDSKPLILSIQDETGESLLNRHDLDFEEYCNIKQGYLAVVMKEEQNQKLGKPVITIKPVFAVLNKVTLTLFENENVKNMYRSYDMKFLKPLNSPLAWEGTHCWQILSGNKNVKIGDKTQKSEKQEKEDNDYVLTSLCSADDLEMNRWMNAIKDFHNCEVKEGTVQQPAVVNQMRKQMDEDIIIEKERDAKDQEEIINLDDQLDQVEEIVAQDQEKLKEKKKEHKMKMEKEEDEIEMLEDKEKCLSENLIEEAKRQEIAREQAMTPAKLDVKDVLKNVTKERMDRIIQEEDTQMFMRKKLENNIRETMMEQTKEFNQNYNSQDCYSDDLKGDYKQHIKNVCGHLYRPDANLQVKDLLACLDQTGFCRHCCNGYLGVNLMDLREQCVGKCTTIVDEVSGSLDMTVPTEQGVTTHGFLYGLEKDEAKKLEKEAQEQKDE